MLGVVRGRVGRGAGRSPGKPAALVNTDPQAEGYSYVNLDVLTTLGTATSDLVATRRSLRAWCAERPGAGGGGQPETVGAPGTLTS
ncbi:hypothetical protein GCM10023340_29530 [Nocardioides marinquilinus]|uniref:Uncharacterized protein n=1 Tax=Nocardioides marinquilinus TaxID=1210400 RepID=A0ABP9PRT5_9ACTN